MSPQRRKGRGGGSSKTMALLPNSSLISPLISATKLAKDQRRLDIANPAISSKVRKQPPNPSHTSKSAPNAYISTVSDEKLKTAEVSKTSELNNEENSRVSELEIADISGELNEKSDISSSLGKKSEFSMISNKKAENFKVLDKKEGICRLPEKKAEIVRISNSTNAEISRISVMEIANSSRGSGKREDISRVSDANSSKPRSSSAARSRNMATENIKAVKSSSIIRNNVRDEGSSRSDHAISRYGFSNNIRAESRGRSSPSVSNLQRKEILEKQIHDESSRSRSRTASKEVIERKVGEKLLKSAPRFMKVNAINNREEDKKVSKVSVTIEERKKILNAISSKDDPSLVGKSITNKSFKASYPQENQIDNVRWSTSALPFSLHVDSSRKASLDSVRVEGYRAKSILSKQDFPNSGRFSTGSSMIPSSKSLKSSYENVHSKQNNLKDSSDKFGASQRLLKERKVISLSADGMSIQHGTENEFNLCNLLQRRLNLLEGKVNKMSAEIRRTKIILNSNDCVHPISVLYDIQDKIYSIEQAMASRTCDDVASLHDVVMEDEFQMTTMQENGRYALECNGSYTGVDDGLLNSGKELSEECVYTQQLSFKEDDSGAIEQNSEYTCVQNVNLGYRENLNAQSWTSSSHSAHSSVRNDGVENKPFESHTLRSQVLDRKVPQLIIEDVKDCLDCDESVPFHNFNENVENVAPGYELEFECDDELPNKLHTIGDKVAVSGWYVSDGEAILLAHDDGCCSYIDTANMEEKAIFDSPVDINMPVWNDCWLIRAAGSDGRANKYVVAASTGNVIDCGFCSWDFESKSLASCHSEYQSTHQITSTLDSPIARSFSREIYPQPRMVMPLAECNAPKYDASRGILADAYHDECCKSPQWWYKPCGPLMAAAASSLTNIALYDIRDGDNVMRWDTRTAIAGLDYSSPIQWRDKGKLVLAEEEAISIWDVHTMDVHCLQYIELRGKQISTLYVHNSDAECNGGVRQRLSSSETDAFDGICCTHDDINVLDFRVPNGIGISFPSHGLELQCAFARRDTVLVGGLNHNSNQCCVQQWSIRKAMPRCIYSFPSSSSHYSHLSLTQVWGSSSIVMAVNGNGVYIFDAWKDSGEDLCDIQEMKDIIGTHDLLNPSFDYANSRVLLISRDRQASWSYLSQ